MKRLLLASALTTLCAATPVAAQSPSPTLTLELNTIESTDTGCRLTFLAENQMAADLSSAVFETVLFTRDGLVDRLTLFDMQSVPEGRPRVRQFDVPGLECGALGRVLINGVHACSGDGIDASACESALELRSRIDEVEIVG